VSNWISRLTLVGLLLPLVLSGVDIRWQFEGGSLERVEKAAPDHFRVFVKGQTDQDKRNRQASWYFFRVDGAPRAVVTLDIVGLPGEYNYQPNRGAITKDTPPVISYDGKTWKHVDDFEYDATEPHLRLRVRAPQPRFWIAHTPPYTLADLDRLRKWCCAILTPASKESARAWMAATCCCGRSAKRKQR
jgi:Cytosolic carboxypeptidase N-terminal domain